MINLTNDVSKAQAITHSGVFHGDEVLATVILEKVFGNLTICRTFKVPENISDEVIVYDIGGGKFDHHQVGGNGKRENGVPYASAGLIWREYGLKILEGTRNPEIVFEIIDRDLIQGVDAIDNGKLPHTDYPTTPLSFSKMVSMYNPLWDDTSSESQCFLDAVEFAKTVFDTVLKQAISTANAKEIVESAISSSENNIMVLEKFVPWQEHLFASENEKNKKMLFVVFPSKRGGYNWQCVPNALNSFGQRKPVPKEWRGLSANELQQITGVKTATFCHQSGFLGATGTLEDAIKMAKLAIES